MPQTLQEIRRCSMRYGIRTAMRQSRRRYHDRQLDTKVKGNHMTARYTQLTGDRPICAPGFIRATTAGEQAIRSRRHAPERKISGCGLAEVTADWREENTPVVMAGRSAAMSAGKLRRIYLFLSVFVYWRTINVGWRQYLDYSRIIVSHDDNHNVMRGEETQLIGGVLWLLPLFMLCPEPIANGCGR